MKKILLLPFLLLLPGVAMSAPTVAGFLNVPLSAQQVGMGGVSIGGQDVLRAWSNPSLLTSQANRGEVGINGGSFFDGSQKGMGAGAGWQFDSGFAVGALLSTMSMNFVTIDSVGSLGAELVQTQTAAALVGAYRSGPACFGVSLKAITESVADNGFSAGAADAGVSVGINAFTVGAAVRNVGKSNVRGTEGVPGGENLPVEIRGGLAYRVPQIGLLVGGEIASAEGMGKIGGGAEWWATPMFALRAGVAGMGAGQGMRISAGLSARLSGVGLDYAMLTHPLGLTHQIGVSYGFGGAMDNSFANRQTETREAPREEPVVETKTAQAGAKPATGLLNMAVSDLTPQGVSTSDAAVIADMLRGELVKSGRFNVIEKQNMDKVLSEQAFQQSGCTSEECAVKLGKLLNVQRMVVGSFGKLMDKYFVNLRVVNVESGAILFADSCKGKSVDEIETGIQDLGRKIANKAR